MFKKGQLVSSKKSRCLYYLVSTKNRDGAIICKLRNVITGGHATVDMRHLKLIGNNFKFKGQSCWQ